MIIIFFAFSVAARKADILRVTEQILDAINNGDFDTYTYVYLILLSIIIISHLTVTVGFR